MFAPRNLWIAALLSAAFLATLGPGASKDSSGVRRASEAQKSGRSVSPVGAVDSPGRTGDRSGTGQAVGEGADPAEEIALLLARWHDTSDPEVRRVLIEELERLEGERREAMRRQARVQGLALQTKGGGVLTGFEGDVPLYDIAHNAEAAISVATDVVRQTAPLYLDGKDHKIGLWDASNGPRLDHDELAGRIEIRDGAIANGLHATHVAATMIGKGMNPAAKGMAPEAAMLAYSSTDMLSELAAVAGVGLGDPDRINVSVHPYGAAIGWEADGTEWYGTFSDDGNRSNDVAALFGQYSSTTAAWDGLAANFPYHLMIKSAGNHADDDPPSILQIWSLNGSPFNTRSYLPLLHPGSDGWQYSAPRRGFGTVDSRGSAKNVLTVGSVRDAVTSGGRDLSAAALSAFSSCGPTDDGRIKPDLVCNGESVYSADGTGKSQYARASGTSMAAASAGGSALLLTELYAQLSDNQVLRASTLKGLMIHTADDLGHPGPDYRNGWGLLNTAAAADLLVSHAGQSQKRFVEERISNNNPRDYFMVMHDGNGPIRATLCWTDPAGNWTNAHDNRSRRLVNDLDLTVTGPDGIRRLPYVMRYSSTFSASDLDVPAVTGVNRVDNVEQVYLPVSAPGLYRFEVGTEFELSDGGQDYALFVSGVRLGASGVTVKASVADQAYPISTLAPITVVPNLNDLFTGSGHTYGLSLSPEGIATAALDPLGEVTLTPTGAAYGPVRVTLTARDSDYGSAEVTFTVTMIPSILRVDGNVSADPAQQNGASWDNAFRYLQDALAIAIAGVEVWIAAGVYYPDESLAGDSNDRNATFTVSGGVEVYGGFAGNEDVRAQRDPAAYLTILSGDLRQDDVQQPIASHVELQSGDGNNSYRVVSVTQASSSGTISAGLDGLVVTAGRSNGGFNSPPYNIPDNAGGGIWVDKCPLRIENCLITGNYSDDCGGGMRSLQGNLVVLNCRFLGNRSGSFGGAVWINTCYATFSHCEFRGNDAPDGGAIWNWKDRLVLSHCLFSGNKGLFGGGALHHDQGEFQIESCTFAGNYTQGAGGAIHVRAGDELNPSTIRNTVIWGNHGGGSTQAPFASIYVSTSTERPTISTSLVANSGGSAGWNSALGLDRGGNLDLDPRFVSGITPGPAVSDEGDFQLQGGSPMIDGGNVAVLPVDIFDLDRDGDVTEAVPLDLAGGVRVVGASVDIGAYELGDPSVLDSDGDGLSDEFEMAFSGSAVGMDALSDLDGDGLTALAEFIHGLDPNAPLREPVMSTGQMGYLGTTYFCATYRINPLALNFARVTVERSGDLLSPLGWLENQVVEVSSVPSSSHPGLLEVTYRSQVPFGQDGMEFIRLRHELAPAAIPAP